jgi:hypothetical protein
MMATCPEGVELILLENTVRGADAGTTRHKSQLVADEQF